MTLAEVSAHFSQSVEVLTSFVLGGPAAGVVQSVYNNVLNRTPDAEGLAFWSQMLDNGAVSRGTFVLEVLGGVTTDAVAGDSDEMAAQRIIDAAYLEDKTNLGLYFSGVKGLNDADDAKAVMESFDGSQSSISAGKALVDQFYADAIDPQDGELLIQMVGIIDDPFFA